MTALRPNLTKIVVDALDPAALADFWSRALSWERAGLIVTPTLPTTPRLEFRRTERPKAGKNRLHLDLGHDAPLAELFALGAERTDIGQGEVAWEVLADIEGNEFCVLPEPGTDGRLVAVCQDAGEVAGQREFWAAETGWVIADEGAWGVSLRAAAGTGPRLVMGPPAAGKSGRNRWRLGVGGTDAGAEPSEVMAADPEGNEFHRFG